jgi:hypothetical protein
MTPAIWLIIAAVYVGLVLGTGVVIVVAYDLWALRYGWRTVSDEFHHLGRTFPTIALVVTGVLCLIVGMLIGHLFLGQ